MLFYDLNYWVYMLPAFAVVLFAQYYVKSTYRRWSKVVTRSRMTGAQAAQRLINTGRLYDVNVEAVSGKMTDHYDPRQKVLRLSQGVYQTASVASVAIAAHELGHAIQDNEAVVNIGSTMGWIFIIIGLFMQWSELAWLGVIVFSAGALFSLATLPIELNASARAKELLVQSRIIVGKEEQKGVNKVLNAAAFTYVAALLTSIMQLLYFTSLVGGMGGRRR